MGTIAWRTIALATQRQRLGIKRIHLLARGGKKAKVRTIAHRRLATVKMTP